jgi:hypothetical protein
MKYVSFWKLTEKELKIDLYGMISAIPYIMHEKVILMVGIYLVLWGQRCCEGKMRDLGMAPHLQSNLSAPVP